MHRQEGKPKVNVKHELGGKKEEKNRKYLSIKMTQYQTCGIKL